MENEISTKFVKSFGVGSDLSMPNEDAMYIKTLLEEGSYKEACEKLIDYYGENSVVALNRKIHDLKNKLSVAESECDDLEQSNEAEHREKVDMLRRAKEAAKLLKRCYTMIGVPCRLDDVESARNYVNAFLETNRDLLP